MEKVGDSLKRSDSRAMSLNEIRWECLMPCSTRRKKETYLGIQYKAPVAQGRKKSEKWDSK